MEIENRKADRAGIQFFMTPIVFRNDPQFSKTTIGERAIIAIRTFICRILVPGMSQVNSKSQFIFGCPSGVICNWAIRGAATRAQGDWPEITPPLNLWDRADSAKQTRPF